eukprot:TRINITY_DN3990_c0_g1_i1.p1 TRINITY_DN3990_c0_g1~~TRINITY_DN3990_c0_g1_i1.p1  ORF type:complete len:446 (+),score=97.74 TRINITY_DN3990_c0_g1_i1:97-1338(+)
MNQETLIAKLSDSISKHGGQQTCRLIIDDPMGDLISFEWHGETETQDMLDCVVDTGVCDVIDVFHWIDRLCIGGDLYVRQTTDVYQFFNGGFENDPEKGYCLRIYEFGEYFKITKCFPFYDERFVLSNGMEMAYFRWGNVDAGVKVLAVHGWLDNGASFLGLAESYVRAYGDDLCFIAIDLCGYGQSGHNGRDTNFHFIDNTFDIYDVIVNQLKWDKVHYLGHSMGGNLGVMLNGAYPELFASNIIIDVLGPFGREEDNAPEFLRDSISRYFKNMDRQKRIYKNLPQVMERYLSVNYCISPEAAQQLVRRGTVRTEDGGYQFSHDNRHTVNAEPQYMSEKQIISFIKKMENPSLVLWAEKRAYKFDTKRLSRREHFPNNQFIEIGGTHHVHCDEPERTFTYISDFLAPLLNNE